MGFAQLRNARGATMYFLPWQGHTIVGSTDKKCDATSSPGVEEDEIQYLVNEAASCLSSDIRVRRSDVLSAWQGWRPLYRDPNAPPGAPVSRHHVVGTDDSSGVIFICGGKWSTYRAMAEELVDKVVAYKNFAHAGPCVTKAIKLIGGEGYHSLLNVQLVQKYGVSHEIAEHLCHTYGACAFAVCEMSRPTGKTATQHRFGRQLVDGYPFIEEEIEYTCKHEMAITVKDMLTLRMRLAYLNSELAKEAIPKVADLMGDVLKWDKKEKAKQIKQATEYIGQFGGPVADKTGAKLRSATFTDLHEVFKALDADGSGYLDMSELNMAAIKLGFPFKNQAECKAKFAEIDTNGNGRISEQEFIEWWNRATPESKKLMKTISLTATSEVALDHLLEGEPKKSPKK